MAIKKRLTNLGSLMRKPTSAQDTEHSSEADTPEANAQRGVRLFCESGAANSGEEVLHLPTIVEAAVASPHAAAAAATQIRKFLSKDNYSKPHVQYNAVMLIRILADNPGASFTKNLDKQFADTVKHLLRSGQDPSVAQILRETLDAMEREKAYDTNLNTLFAMWRKEKGLMANAQKHWGPRTLNAPAWGGQQIQGGFGSGGGGGGGSRSRSLPPPIELAGRIEEARTSAKLLLQLVQSTPANELLGNELVKEFSERCMSAQRSVQGYINCDNPAPDDDTMLTLIETNEQLSLAASKHQRAILQARRMQGQSPSPPISTANNPPQSMYNPPPQPPPRQEPSPIAPVNVGSTSPTNSYDKTELPLPPSLQAGGAIRRPQPNPQPEDNPFADTYAAPPGPPPGRAADDDDDAPTNGHRGGSPTSYNPGYQSTPSYLGRQESSANHLTMHGGAQPIAEGNEGSNRPATPDQNRPRNRDSDVSPIAERAPVTYRF